MKKTLILTVIIVAIAHSLTAMMPLNLSFAQAQARVPQTWPWTSAQQSNIIQLCAEMVTQSRALVATGDVRVNADSTALMDQFISLATNLNVQMRTINPDAALAIGLRITQLMSTHSIFMRAVYLQTHNTARRGRIMMSEYFESQLSQK